MLGQVGIGRVLEESEVERQTKRRQRGSDFIVEVPGQASPLFANGSAGDVLEQENIREGQGHGLERLGRCLVFGLGRLPGQK